ncbi:ribonuclease P/MRP protein subunit RPP1 [Capronia epimyces CBS 606.96]|uniref:Ribonuclease P/MRP protein subunit RPP1 n=1 Tax=Capronia epimyces CBS 606.96 TaxID=1182542 RepID=W9YXI7_9EURO|nr:ribonuclease P/MRP protein subunit RPP1 [Capronia epimyces CBS 606.96]EXJ87009.1 ribonuclease P/MRP protein subunit RPP1 [Capronia epimyces CBS 606.96]
MPFHDLNVPYTANHADQSHTLAFHAELGYSVVAVSVAETGKLPPTLPTIPVSALTVPKSITTVLTRLTLTISDAAQNHRLASLQSQYSLLALRPTNEKALQLCCSSLDCDLISLDFSQRLPFWLKFTTVSSALQRGVRFEICYGPGVQGGNPDARRNLISGSAALIRATRGRGIILSSEAKNALGVRGPHDVINLAQVWGLGQERGKEALCEEAGKVVRLAALKRSSFRGVVQAIEGGAENTSIPAKKVERLQQTQKEKASNPARWAGGKNSVVREQEATRGKNSVVKEQGTTKDGREETETGFFNLNGTKRKSSTASLTPTQSAPTRDGEEKQPLSKRETKRRAKKARLERQDGPRPRPGDPEAACV